MAKIELTIPDDKLQTVLNAFDDIYERPYTWDGVPPNATRTYTHTKAQWAKERVRRFIVDTVQQYQRKLAIKAAEQNTVADDTIAL